MNVQVVGRCSLCGGRVTCPTGPIGYVGPIEDLISCESCGAKKASDLPVVKMEPPRRDHDALLRAVFGPEIRIKGVR